MHIHWIWLHHRPKVTDRMKAELLEHFPDAEDVYFAQKTDYAKLETLTPEAMASLQDKKLDEAQKILETCENKGLKILTIGENAYPQCLKNIADPPLVLYYKGLLPDFDGNPVIAIVGTRKASAYGMNAANRLGYQIAACGGIVVSGLASGIDAMAMQGALTGGMPVVGVLGCGVDVVYPKSNRQLFEMVEKYGCILSEFAPGTQPARWTFPKRNRIISGLSNGVLVVEAPEKSGALITANLALEQGRDVFVVPGNIDQMGFIGSNRLIRDGASVVSSGWDVLCEYEGLYPGILRKDLSEPHLRSNTGSQENAVRRMQKSLVKVAQKVEVPAKKPNLIEKLTKKAIDKEPSGSYSDVNDACSQLSQEERKIVEILRDGDLLVDEVIDRTRIDAGKLLGFLTMLELKGFIRRQPGKRITLVRKTDEFIRK